MALNSSGPLSLGGATTGQSINLELGQSATALASINATNFRNLAGVPSGQISISNFYGKSSISFNFFTMGQGGPSNAFAAFDSSGNTYQTFKNSGTNVVFAKYSASGTKTFANYLTTIFGNDVQAMNVTGSNWYIANNNSQMSYTKLDTSGTFAWNRGYEKSGYLFWQQLAVYQNAAGDMYGAFRTATGSGKSVTTLSGVVKINSGGTLQWVATRSEYTGVRNVAEVGSYLYLYGSNSNIGQVIRTDPSNGTTSYNAGLTNGVKPIGTYDGYTVETGRYDPVNSMHYLFGYTVSPSGSEGGAIAQFPLALNTNNWLVLLLGGGSIRWYSGTTDSSGNVYAMGDRGGNPNNAVLVKYNSSGVLQWQRNIVASSSGGGSTSLNNPRSLAVYDTKVMISGGAYVNNGTQNCFYALQYPTDGSKTGVYTNAGLQFTISASSWTAFTPPNTTYTRDVTQSSVTGLTLVSQTGGTATATNTFTATAL